MGKPSPPTPKWHETILTLLKMPYLAFRKIHRGTEVFVKEECSAFDRDIPTPSISVRGDTDSMRRRRNKGRGKIYRPKRVKVDIGYAWELVDSLETHLYSVMGMKLPANNLVSTLSNSTTPRKMMLCAELGSNMRAGFNDAGIEYDVVLRRVIDNQTAGRYLDDIMGKSISYLGKAASKMGMRSSDLLAACLMCERKIVLAMAQSEAPYSLLGNVSIAEQHENGRKTQKIPIIVIPGNETMPEILKWELKYRKEYFCE